MNKEETELAVREVVAQIVGYEACEISEFLMELPGFSLAALQILARLQRHFGVEITLQTLLQTPTLSGLVEAVFQARRLVEFNLTSNTKGASDDGHPLSAPQRCFVQVAMPKGNCSAANNLVVFRTPWLDEDAARYALLEIVEKHEVLGSFFTAPWDNGFQHYRRFRIEELPIEFSPLGESNLKEKVSDMIAQAVSQVLPIEQWPLWRLKVHRMASGESLGILVVHNLVADGYSLALLRQELQESTSNRLQPTSRPRERNVNYAEVANWHEKERATERFEKDRAYWHQILLRSTLPETRLDFERTSQEFAKGWSLLTRPQPQLAKAVEEFAFREGLTPFVCLLTAYGVLISGILSESESIIGVPTHGRFHPNSLDMVGSFALPVPVRIESAKNYRDACAQTGDSLYGYREHWRYQFDDLLNDLAQENREPFPLIKCLFNQEWLPGEEVLGRDKGYHRDIGRVIAFHLQGVVGRSGDGWQIDWIYRDDVFTNSTIETFVEAFWKGLEELIRDCESVSASAIRPIVNGLATKLESRKKCGS